MTYRHPFSKACLQHSLTVIQPCMWFMEEPSQFSVGQTAQNLTCYIMEKPHTGLGDCLRMLQTCFRKRMSGDIAEGEWRVRISMSCSGLSDSHGFKHQCTEWVNSSASRFGQTFLWKGHSTAAAQPGKMRIARGTYTKTF